jgi:citrate lyase subunit beta/citryl-CoA lyase
VQALGPSTKEAERDMTLPIRSFLFIPGDSEKKIGKVDDVAADAFIFDLEDAVAPARKPVARAMVPAFIKDRPRAERKSQLWVRINPLDTAWTLEDLAAIVPSAPDGIMLPKVDGPQHVAQVSHYLDALEAAAGIAAGSIKILPVATETAIAPFRLGDYAGAGLNRLYGLTWGAEDLSSAIGASGNTDATGEWTQTYKMVRSLCLLGAHAAGVEAVDTLYVDFRDPDGLRASCKAARAEGFSGRIAIHPAQVDVINEAFSPSEDEVAFAQRVVALFAANPDSGTLALDGKMLDIPHLKQASKTLAMHEACRG